MLKKVFFYDSRAIARQQMPLLIALLAGSITACGLAFALRSLLMAQNVMEQGVMEQIALPIVATLYGLTVFGIAILPTLCGFLIYSRFYRSLYTDEGYLTMVLPLNTHTLLGGKLLAGFVWQLVLSVLSIVCMGIAVMPVGYEIVADLWTLIREGILAPPTNPSVTIDADAIGMILFTIQTVLGVLLSAVVGILQIYTAICLGGGLFRRRKILGAFLFAYVISMVMSTLQSIVALPSLIGTLASAETYMIWLNVTVLLQNLLYAAMGVGMYILMLTLLRKKINLE